MADIAKLKKKAAEYEQKKQLDKALAEYVKILDEMDSHVDEADVALYNRVGDLMLRQGSASQAVQYYEKAVDLYTEGGFFNNAIALCNKILRNAPGHSAVHYKLGKISAKKGFINDAKQHFLEYADRMQKEGRLEEAFRALKEFADLCPDQDDIRLMLADQLIRRNRKGEAIEQLQLLYEKFQAEGRSREARATVERMRAIDPEIEPKITGWAPTPKSGDLVFLDVGVGPVSTPAPPASATPPGGAPIAPPAGLSHGSAFAASQGDAKPIPPPSGGARTNGTNGTRAPGVEHKVGGPGRRITTPSSSPATGWFGNGTSSRVPTDLPLIFPPDEPDGYEPFQELEPIADESLASAPEAAAEPETNGKTPHADVDPIVIIPVETETPLLRDRTPASTLSIDGGFDDAAALLPEPAWSTMPDERAQETARAPDIDIQLEQSAFLTPTTNSAIGISHDSRRPNDLGDTNELPVASIDALPELAGIAPTSEESEPSEPTQDGVEPAVLADASPRDSIDSLYGIEERSEIEGDNDAPTGSPLVFIPPEFGPDSDRRLTGPHAAIVMPDDASSPVELLSDDAPTAPSSDERSAIDELRDRIAARHDDWEAHRDLGLAILAGDGDRGDAVRALSTAMAGFERNASFAEARDVARHVVAVDPHNLAQHQKHVEFAVKSGERGAALVDAYGGLAEALLRVNLADKARAIFLRIVDLAPDNDRAREMLDKIPAPTSGSLYVTGVMLAVPAPAKTDRLPTPRAATAQPSVRDDKFVNLADWLRDDEPPKSTRMITDEPDQTAAANSDFADMLTKFKAGVAANVDEGDHESHYDLGIAYKEMGLLDEAVAEFQKALRSTENRVRTYEALGQCFVEKKQYQIALTILGRALAGGDAAEDVLVGVLYLLGVANEALGKRGDAATFFRRVVAVDIRFRDAADRLAALERAAS